MNWKKLMYLISLFGTEIGQLAELFYDDGQSKNKDGVERFMHETPFFQHHESKSLKHKAKFLAGEKTDKDSGLNPQVHVIARELIILWGDNHREELK